MKFSASLFVLAALALTGCNNLVTRRDLYSPTKPNGPYTQARKTGKLPQPGAPGTVTTTTSTKPVHEEANPLPQ